MNDCVEFKLIALRAGNLMSIASQSTRQIFPFSFDQVFDGIIEVIPYQDMQVKTSDRLLGRITAVTGMSMFSWGEHVTLLLEKIDDSRTALTIESSLVTGLSLRGSHRHHENFEKLISALSACLQTPVLVPSGSDEADFEVWLSLQRPPIPNPTASQRAELRAAFDWNRKNK